MTELNNNMDFQTAYAALKETVAALEDQKTEMDEAIALYERACRLVLYCRRKLSEAEGKITDINERVAQLKNSTEPLFED